MTEAEFSRNYQAETPVYEAWGRIVTDTVLSSLASVVDLKTFLKVPAVPRVKDLESAIAKAFYRDKGYSDPIAQMTDKAGTRFVVLLEEGVSKVSELVEEQSLWSCSRDRDFEEERRRRPLLFDYQSVHYIATCEQEVVEEEVVIPRGTTCEVQIRTILQHAYSELTHDTIYKPKGIEASAEIRRAVAKSMALIETTDSLFMEATMDLRKQEQDFEDVLSPLRIIYSKHLPCGEERSVSLFLLDAIRDIVEEDGLADRVETFVSQNPFVVDNVKGRAEGELLYRQPLILLIYLLARDGATHALRQRWPFTPVSLRRIYTDLGKKWPDS